jgi:hypothetical protein
MSSCCRSASAWTYFRERLDEIAAACDFVANQPDAGAQPRATCKASEALKRIAYPMTSEPNGLTRENGIKQLFSHGRGSHGETRVDLGAYELVRDGVRLWQPRDVYLGQDQPGSMPALPLGRTASGSSTSESGLIAAFQSERQPLTPQNEPAECTRWEDSMSIVVTVNGNKCEESFLIAPFMTGSSRPAWA